MEREWESSGARLCTFFSVSPFHHSAISLSVCDLFWRAECIRDQIAHAPETVRVCVLKRGGARIRLLFSPDLLQNEIGFLGSTPAAGKKHFKGSRTWCGEKLSWKTEPKADSKHSTALVTKTMQLGTFFSVKTLKQTKNRKFVNGFHFI